MEHFALHAKLAEFQPTLKTNKVMVDLVQDVNQTLLDGVKRVSPRDTSIPNESVFITIKLDYNNVGIPLVSGRG